MKSPVTCMIIINDYLWVGSHSGVKVYNAANRQLIGSWITKTVVTAMILVPDEHQIDKEALVMLTKSKTILIFTLLQWQNKQRLLQDIKPDREIDMHCEIFCALLVPIINQLWMCTADNKLVIFNSGCYDNHEKYDMPDMLQPHCMATVDEIVLVAGGAKIQKWDTTEIPGTTNCLDCTGTIMDKVSSIHYGESLVGNN